MTRSTRGIGRERAAWRLPAGAVPDALLAGAFAILAVWSRARSRAPGFVSMDASLLALGVHEYGFALNQPHPPYYPLTIALGRVVAALPGVDPYDALAWLAVAAAGATTAGTYLLGWRLAGRMPGVLAAAVVLLSPLALRNGTVPLSYALEGAAAVAVAGLAWRGRQASSSLAAAAALGAAASLAVGLRPSAAILLAPVALWGAWRSGRHVGAFAIAGAATTLAWLVPALVAGGGIDWFLAGLRHQGATFVLADPVWSSGAAGVADRAAWLSWHLRRESEILVGSALLLAVCAVPLRHAWRSPRVHFLAAWSVPGLAFYVLVYAGWPVYPDGYLMAILPAAALACALALRAVAAVVSRSDAHRAAQAFAFGVVFAVAAQPLGWIAQWDDAQADAEAALDWEASWSGFSVAFPANETAVIAFYAGPWLRLEHPEHLVWITDVFARGDGRLHTQVTQARGLAVDKPYLANLADGDDDAPHEVPAWVRRIVVVDGHPGGAQDPLLVPDAEVKHERLASGRLVPYVEATGVATVEELLAFVQAGPVAYARRAGPPA